MTFESSDGPISRFLPGADRPPVADPDPFHDAEAARGLLRSTRESVDVEVTS